MHALVVDDSHAIRMILTAYLKKLGFEVTAAVNGREALDRLQGMEKADVVLVDWNMPEMDGLSFVRAVRADVDYATLPVMMVTTNTELEHVSEALEAGANEYIMKPFTADMIREKLELLGLSRRTRQHAPSRVLIVDDSVVIRRALTAALRATPGLEVVGAASSGRIALMKIPLLQPDVVALDIEMPDRTASKRWRPSGRRGPRCRSSSSTCRRRGARPRRRRADTRRQRLA